MASADADDEALLRKIQELERETRQMRRQLGQKNKAKAAPAAEGEALPTPRGRAAKPPTPPAEMAAKETRAPRERRPRQEPKRSRGEALAESKSPKGPPKRLRDGAPPRRGRRPSKTSDRSDDETPGRVRRRVMWVSSEQDAKGVAHHVVGAALPSAKVGFPVSLHAKSEANVNTALKGVAIAAKRCAEDGLCALRRRASSTSVDPRGDEPRAATKPSRTRRLTLRPAGPIACRPMFRETRAELTVSVVALVEQIPDVDAPGANVQTLTVSKNTDYRVLAGAAAGRARAGQASCIRAIGAASVYVAARAIATCREYLDADDESLDVAVLPRFDKVVQKGNGRKETTVLELVVFPVDDEGSSL